MATQLSKQEKEHWARQAPKTAQYPYADNKASGTPQFAREVLTADDLYKFIENYPREPATLSLIYEPECIRYFFQKLTITDDELELAKKIIKSHVYTQVLAKCRDSSILDRLDANINPRVEINFNVLPAWNAELLMEKMPKANTEGDDD